MFQSNGGWEFDNSTMISLFEKHGIYFQKSYLDIQDKMGLLKESIGIFLK